MSLISILTYPVSDSEGRGVMRIIVNIDCKN